MKELFLLYGDKEIEKIINATGIERVRIADVGETSSDMCFNAVEHLLREEKIKKDDISGLVFVSQTADYILPSTAIILQDRIGLNTETICLDIHYGCSGYIYGIFQAALWIQSGMCENVLVLAGDTSSRMINAHDKSLRMVFGDCGTATLISKGDFPIGVSLKSDGSGYDKLIVPAGGFRKPISSDTSVLQFDQDGNGRTGNGQFMDGRGIFNFFIS